MGALLGQTNTNNHNLGAVRLTSIILPPLGIIRGLSRRKKRNQRDEALNELYNMGMDRNIYLHHSDHWGVARQYADWASQDGNLVIDTLNKNIKIDTAGDGKTGRWIYSANSEQYVMLQNKIMQAIREEREKEAERRAEEEAERKAKEEADKKAQETTGQTTDSDGNGGGSVPAVPENAQELIENPYVIGGAALGVGVLALLLLRG